MWLVTAILDSAGIKHLHHCKSSIEQWCSSDSSLKYKMYTLLNVKFFKNSKYLPKMGNIKMNLNICLKCNKPIYQHPIILC